MKPEETVPGEESNVTQQEEINTSVANFPLNQNNGKFVSGGVETDLEKLEKRCKRFGIPFNPPKSAASQTNYPVNTSSQPSNGKFVSGGVETDLEKLEKRCKRFGIPFNPPKSAVAQANTTKQVKRARNETNTVVSIV